MADGRREEQANFAERRANTVYNIPTSSLPFGGRTSISCASACDLKWCFEVHSRCVPMCINTVCIALRHFVGQIKLCCVNTKICTVI